MYVCSNTYEGLAPRLYRTPEEIRRDIGVISHKIKTTGEMLSVHNILTEMIPIWAECEPEKWIEELEGTLREAEGALSELKLLNRALDELREELDEVRCVMKI